MAGRDTAEPRKIDGYEVVRRLGGGGMGVVYLVADRSGRQLALKQIRPEMAQDQQFRARFAREVAAARRVHSDFTAAVIDADVEAVVPYVVTEYIDGPNLADAVETAGPLRDAQLLALAVGLARALAEIHRLGLVHRDVKPSNVLLANDGPKLIDFGIAHAADSTQLTRTGVTTGSPGWMAPEQVTGQTTSPSTDIFSWAATVAYAATGRHPFGEGRSDAVLYRVIHEDADLAGVPSELRSLLARSLSKQPGERPSTSELLRAGDLTVTAGIATDDGDATAALDAVTAAWRPDPAWNTAAVDSEPRPRRRRTLLAAAAVIVVVGAIIATALIAWNGRTDQDRESVAATDTTSTAPTTTSTTSTTVSTTTTSTVPDATTLDVGEFLPEFHDELDRLVAGRMGGPRALLVASSPRQPEPRPVTFTLIEWDRDHYAVADQLEIDCSFVEQLIIDEDQAIFLGCTGGASAHFAYALVTEPLEIQVLPYPTDGEEPPGAWLVGGFDPVPRSGQPDDLTLYGKRCEPSCAESKVDVYDLVWSPSFRWWDLVSCTEEGQQTIYYDPPWNGSVSHITYDGCPR